MESKICLGPLHPPGGELIPIEEFSINKSGPRAGKPLSRCKLCRSSGNPATVTSEVFMPLIDFLFEGRNLQQVSELTGLNKELLRDLKKGKRKRIYKNTFLNIKRAVSSIPREKTSIGPQNYKSKRNGLDKLSYEERLGLRQLVSEEQKRRFKIERKLLKHVV